MTPATVGDIAQSASHAAPCTLQFHPSKKRSRRQRPGLVEHLERSRVKQVSTSRARLSVAAQWSNLGNEHLPSRVMAIDLSLSTKRRSSFVEFRTADFSSIRANTAIRNRARAFSPV